MTISLWCFPESVEQHNITGFKVKAADGPIGKVVELRSTSDLCYLVVKTKAWGAGRKVILPAGLLGSVDLKGRRVSVTPTRDVIRDAPAYDGEPSQEYLLALCDYYLERPPEDGDVLTVAG